MKGFEYEMSKTECIDMGDYFRLFDGRRMEKYFVNSLTFYRNGVNGIRLLHTIDDTIHGKLRHVSVSYFDHDPTWEELKGIKEQLFGDIDAMIVLPKNKYYVNLQEHTFHIWQMPVDWNIS